MVLAVSPLSNFRHIAGPYVPTLLSSLYERVTILGIPFVDYVVECGADPYGFDTF